MASPERWRKFVAWLDIDDAEMMVERRQVAGTPYYGLYAVKDIAPNSLLFAVPSRVLLNSRTLASHYSLKDLESLSAVQLISLHLLLHRPAGQDGKGSTDPRFGPYISVLPRDFDYHPLTWTVKKNIGPPLSVLTPSVTGSLQQMSFKFRSDLRAICSFVHRHSNILDSSPKKASDFAEESETLISDYLWAWLNVNTRCIYYQIKTSPADPDNLTLCPMLDFANHTSHLPCMNPTPTSRGSRAKVDSGISLYSPETLVDVDNELYLKYGSHCNRILFTEYGFVLNPDSIPEDQHVFEVKIDDLIQDLFVNKGETGSWTQEVLVTQNYWLDWTMHCNSGRPFLSYRLIIALRLLSIFPAGPVPLHSEAMLRPWTEVVLGQREQLSSELERAWREILCRLCTTIIDRASRALADPIVRSHEGLVVLWLEEQYVAERILDSAEKGEEL